MREQIVLASSSMTELEAREATEKIRSGLESVRVELYAIYTREGWLALGYESFNSWAVGEFDIHYSYLHRQKNTALLEEALGIEIGSMRESHLRPLIEVLPSEDERVEAYRLLGGQENKAEAYRLAAYEVYLQRHAPTILLGRYEAGLLSLADAYGIAKLVKDNQPLPAIVNLLSLCSDINLAEALLILSKKGGEVWQEILASRTVPAYPDPIAIDKATSATLKAWLDTSSAEHRAVHVEENRDKYDKRSQVTGEIISLVRQFVAGKYNNDEEGSLLAWERIVELINNLDEL